MKPRWALRRLNSCGGHVLLLGEAFAAEDGPALGGAERHGGGLAALGASGVSLDAAGLAAAAHGLSTADHRHAPGLAILAPLRFVSEVLVMKKQLLSGGEDEVSATFHAAEYLVLKFH